MTKEEYKELKVGDMIEYRAGNISYGYFIILERLDNNEISALNLKRKIKENLWSYEHMIKI